MPPPRKITPVILSGGTGSRLWPLSRKDRPKQLLSLTHEQTLLQLTALRTHDPSRFIKPIVVANADHAALIEEQLAHIELYPTLILEPVARNTAPAIALAAFAAPEALMLVMPSDHVIANPSVLHKALDAAAGLAEDGWLVTFGIAPTRPDTGYGYIRTGCEIAPGVRAVDAFVEKPALAMATQYLAQGCYLWNAGIFLFRAETYISELEAHAPDIATACRAAMAQSHREGRRIYPALEPLLACRSDSVDFAIMEKAKRVAVVPAPLLWSDVGSWDALHDLGRKDAFGNARHGEIGKRCAGALQALNRHGMS